MKPILFFSLALALISCNNDDNDAQPLGSYDNGVLVLNEGGAGTVDYIHEDLQTGQQDIFTLVNGNAQDIGQYAQSMFFDGARAFIISNGSNKITVVNRYTFEYIATISTGLSVPRYGVVSGGKAYVTNMASFFNDTDDYVAVIDLSNLSVGAPIAMNAYADRIAVGGGKIWVANGAFGSGNSVTVIDPATGQVSGTIATGLAPNSLEYKDGIVHVMCATSGQGGKLVRIDAGTATVADAMIIPGLYPQNLDIEGQKAYFTAGTKIYSVELEEDTFVDSELVDTQSESDYIGYGFAVNGGRIYISEAAEDFSSNGFVLVYDLSGNLIAEILAGLGPNGFYFN